MPTLKFRFGLLIAPLLLIIMFLVGASAPSAITNSVVLEQLKQAQSDQILAMQANIVDQENKIAELEKQLREIPEQESEEDQLLEQLQSKQDEVLFQERLVNSRRAVDDYERVVRAAELNMKSALVMESSDEMIRLKTDFLQKQNNLVKLKNDFDALVNSRLSAIEKEYASKISRLKEKKVDVSALQATLAKEKERLSEMQSEFKNISQAIP